MNTTTQDKPTPVEIDLPGTAVQRLEAEAQQQQVTAMSVGVPDNRPTVNTMPVPVLSPAVQLMHMIDRFMHDPSIDVAKLEALVKMQDAARKEAAEQAFYQALSEFQRLNIRVHKRGKIIILDKNDKDKVIQSTPYALWEDIHALITPKLSELGLVMSFRHSRTPDGLTEVTCVLAHRMGHVERSPMALPLDTSGSKNNVQAVGSSTSYAKRYTACSMLNIITIGDDDDGQTAEGKGLTEDQTAALQLLIKNTGADLAKFLDVYKIEALEHLPKTKLEEATKQLKAFAAKNKRASK